MVQNAPALSRSRLRRTPKSKHRRIAWLLVILATQLIPSPAYAFNTKFSEFGQSIVCGDQSASQYVFTTQTEWTDALKLQFDAGYDAWQQDVESWAGGLLLSESGQTWTAKWQALAGEDAHTTCTILVHNIIFDSNQHDSYAQGMKSLTAAAAHEWGHAWGLGHAGNYDGVGANPPTLATCTSSAARATLNNDDEAAITAQNEVVDGYATATANSSFEENDTGHLGYWSTQSLAGVVASSSGGGVDGSPWYARFKGDGSSNAAMYNDTYVTTRAANAFKGRANYRAYTSLDSGYVTVTFKYHAYVHDGGCEGLTLTSAVGAWLTTSKTCTPHYTYWDMCTTDTFGAPYGYDSNGNERVTRTRIVVYNHMEIYIGGVGWTEQYVKIDRTRTMGQGTL
jgi:hypothetical protein